MTIVPFIATVEFSVLIFFQLTLLFCDLLRIMCKKKKKNYVHMLNPFHDVHCYFWSLFSLDKISICGFHLLFLNSKELDSV